MSDLERRMSLAIAQLEAKWGGKRKPKAFYLNADDWAVFNVMHDELPTFVRVPFGNNPTVWRDEPAYCCLPVRPSKSTISKLYNHTTQGSVLPQ
jgi:hypothetical protein